MKLLVSSTQERASQIIEALGLDRSEWMPWGMGQALMGGKFDKIVALMPYTCSLVERTMHQQYVELDLSIKLPPGERVRAF